MEIFIKSNLYVKINEKNSNIDPENYFSKLYIDSIDKIKRQSMLVIKRNIKARIKWIHKIIIHKRRKI